MTKEKAGDAPSTAQTLQAMRLMLFDVHASIEARRVAYIRALTPLVPLKDLAVVQEVGGDVVVRIAPPTAAEWVAHLETRAFCQTDPAFAKLYNVSDLLDRMIHDMETSFDSLNRRTIRLDKLVNEHVARASEGGRQTTRDIVAMAAHQRQDPAAPNRLSTADIYRKLEAERVPREGGRSLQQSIAAKEAALEETARAFETGFRHESKRINDRQVPTFRPPLRADNVFTDPWAIAATHLAEWGLFARQRMLALERGLAQRLDALELVAGRARVDRHCDDLARSMWRIRQLEIMYAIEDATNVKTPASLARMADIAGEVAFLEDGPVATSLERLASIADADLLHKIDPDPVGSMHLDADPWAWREGAARRWYESTRTLTQLEVQGASDRRDHSDRTLAAMKREFYEWTRPRALELYVWRTIVGLVAQCEVAHAMRANGTTPGDNPYALADALVASYSLAADDLYARNPREEVAVDDLLRRLFVWHKAPELDDEYERRFKARLTANHEEGRHTYQSEQWRAVSGNRSGPGMYSRVAAPLPSLEAGALALVARWHASRAARRALASRVAADAAAGAAAPAHGTLACCC